jgi:glucose-6-phosphate isomerase
MLISLDYTNMMADVVGAEAGISDNELEALQAPTREFHSSIIARRQRGELPFFDLPFDRGVVQEIKALAESLQQRFENVVVLGIGGSALGTTAVFSALRPVWHNLVPAEKRDGLPRLFVFDNVDPDGFASNLEALDPLNTCFLVISKSGSTVETTCQFLIAREWVSRSVGEEFRAHFILITDPEQGALRTLASEEGYRSCAIPPGVGGRFSVFTAVGLLPLACAGVDIERLLKGAADFSPHLNKGELFENPAYLNAALQYLAYEKGLRISVMMPYSDRLRDIADWFRQLWAESLGKKQRLDGTPCHVGPTPVQALGTTDQHSQVQLYMEGPVDKVVTFLALENYDQELPIPDYPQAPSMSYLAGHSMAELIQMERLATSAALTRNGRPNCTITLPSVTAESVGALLYMLEVQTLFAGSLFDVDPLDQPGVEEGKAFTYALMGRSGFEEKGREYADLQACVKPRQLAF